MGLTSRINEQRMLRAIGLNENRTNVGKIVEIVRKAAGLSQSDIGRQMGYAPSFISKIESGERSLTMPDIFLFVHITGGTNETVTVLARAAGLIPHNHTIVGPKESRAPGQDLRGLIGEAYRSDNRQR